MKNFTKIYFTGLLIFLGIQAQAQVKVGTNLATINPDAALEVEHTSKGLLLPRVALTSTTDFAPLSAHVLGMTVYNTATTGDVKPGYYYNDGAKWVKLANNNDMLEPWKIQNTSNSATLNTDNIYQQGKVAIGFTQSDTPISTLEVNGAATNKAAFDAGNGTTIDFSKSNLAFTSANNGNTFTLQNIKDGGTYTLAVKGTVSGISAFTAAGFTVHLPTDNGPSTDGKHTIYTLLVIGTDVYMSWITGY
ncbi:MAG: hypothetical protein EOO98_00045 [Pedobacter sp.]|nr:MAG: hypothetical protein EOO98_00045 [Pedobacter sp.]